MDCTCAASGSGKLILSLCKRYDDVEFLLSMCAIDVCCVNAQERTLSKGAVHFLAQQRVYFESFIILCA
jgi:hypothetical protein